MLHVRREDGADLPVLVWRFDAPVRVISSAPFGGGVGVRSWVLNAEVASDYRRTDPSTHVQEIAAQLSLHGAGTGMLTAADLTGCQRRVDGHAEVFATVGISKPTYAAAADLQELGSAALAGTINVVAWLPVALSDAALVNAVSTVTEAKTQALFDAGIAGTGTATDALVIACPDGPEPERELFGGPRSTWGARLARATYAAVLSGASAGAQ